ncbi:MULTISPECIES: glutathione S-transferase family protein [unclassified Thioalkalivibrio]|uniref:glutathione S-transferase family protein n=1 Tax=unclassified Thioalkalivibrio TaxID=2621013 RepID=UPI0003710741|nr:MULTISPECIES: glutathione S-transferase family protein [unclassified Thioalkalivibrio]
MNLPHLHLISFAICPFVQRSVITLKYKQAPFELSLIDLADPPEWFRARSPLGKVPVLIVDDDTVLFESAVINEYIDAITPPALMPVDPLEQARTRAWIEYLSEQTFAQYHWMTAATEDAFELARHTAARGLERLEQQMTRDDRLATPDFSLIDATLAPILMRYALLADPDSPWEAEAFPRLAQRWERLREMPAVRDSVPADFAAQLADYLRKQEGFAPAHFAAQLDGSA